MSVAPPKDFRVNAKLQFAIALIGVVALVGCGTSQGPSPANVSRISNAKATASASSPQSAESDKDITPQAAPAADQPIAPDNNTPEAANRPSSESITEKKSEPPAPPLTPERIAILTPGGPLLVDVRLTISGQPHTKALDELVKRVLDAGDTDHDGRSTWKELVADRAYLEKEMPKAPAADSRQMKTLIESYDDNRDGRIQAAEAAAWVGRDAGGTARPFTLRSTRAYRPVPRATSQVWHLIDADKDGRLSRDEIEGASARLLSLDADDDRVLAPAEMATLREQLESAGQQRMYVSRDANHYAAMHLAPDTEIDRLHYLLSDLYAPQQDLGPQSFIELPSLFEKLDASGDEWLDSDELASLIKIEPHLVLHVAFSEAAEDKAGVATIEVESPAPEMIVGAKPSADRAVLSLGNTRLILSAHNLPAPPDAPPSANQTALRSQIRLMVHDQADALFEELDANADGRLGEREIAFCAKRLAERDRNGDGQLSGDEFPYSMIVAFLLGERANEQSFYVPPSPAIPATKTDKPLDPWFSRADLNGDGDVSRREFLGSSEQFHRLDADHDGYLAPAEITAAKK